MECKKCGYQIREGNNFCTKCGMAVNSEIKEKNNFKKLYILVIIILFSIIMILLIKDNKKSNNNTINENVLASSANNKIFEDKDNEITNDRKNNIVNQYTLDTPDILENKIDIMTSESINNSNTDDNIKNDVLLSNNDNEEFINTNSSTIDNANSVLVYIDSYSIKGKNREEIKSFIESKNLQVNFNKRIENVAYCDNRANTSEFETVEEYYNSNDVVQIDEITYVGTNWNATLAIPHEFKVEYDGKNCVMKEYNRDYECYYCLKNNPFDNFNYIEMGADFYINETKLEETNNYLSYNYDDLYGYNYSFSNEENIVFKIVAPYLYDKTTEKIIGQNVTIYEKNLKVSELYINSKGREAILPIPTIW